MAGSASALSEATKGTYANTPQYIGFNKSTRSYLQKLNFAESGVFRCIGVCGIQRRKSVISSGVVSIRLTEFSYTCARASWSLSLALWGVTKMDGYWVDDKLRIRHRWRSPKKLSRPECGAKCRDGHACRAPAVWNKRTNRPRNGRCKLHGGLSTGPRTAEGKTRIAAAQRERWRRWREQKAQS